MKEQEFIKIINETLSDNSYLGDDCAYLKEFGLFVTHDTMVENVHFSLKYSTPYQIGYKAVITNLSDLAAALSIPLYLTVSVSLPKNTDNDFVKELFEGINSACKEYNVKVTGGDITGAENIIISICAIGKKQTEFISSRSNAKAGDLIVTTGTHGSSGAGLQCFLKNTDNNFLKNKHLKPKARFDAVKKLLPFLNENIACMDTSDGLYDAVMQIAQKSNLSAKIDIKNIPYDKEIEIFKNYQELILSGGEDYELVFALNREIFEKLDKNLFFKIGEFIKKNEAIVLINDIEKNLSMQQPKFFDHFD